MDFSGKRVLVAGGSRGIGRSVALGFAKAGGAVFICARGAEALEQTRGEIAAHGGPAHAAACDLADAAAIAAMVPAAAKALGGIDVLVNNASGFGMADDEAGWAAGFAVDVMAIVRATQAALPWLEPAHGAVVNVSSISGLRGSTRSPSYGAVKAASMHYTRSQALTYAAKGIRVNCVAPGAIEFPGGSWEKRRSDNAELYNRTRDSIPFGRLGAPEEVADVVMFLASPYARWVTGQTLAVDGGQFL